MSRHKKSNVPGGRNMRLADQIQQDLAVMIQQELDVSRAGLITLTAESKGPLVAIEVADNGRGIAPADHERIFELFRRSRTQNVPGEGIGLALTVVGLVLIVVLLTYDSTDPSLNTAVNPEAGTVVHNVLGTGGALIADLLIQTLGR